MNDEEQRSFEDRHAYLIIAHKHNEQLKELLRLLDDPRNDIFIHMDIKDNGYEESFCNFLRYSKIFHVKRTNVMWGGYSQINAELLLLKEAIKKGQYHYLHLISGQDLPIKSQDEIHKLLIDSDKEYIGVMNKCVDELRNRFEYYYLFQEKIGRKSRRIYSFIETKILNFQRVLHIKRNKGLQLKKGCNWFSITDQCARYIIKNEKWIKKHFKFSYCCDEIFLQTLIYNSPFKDKIPINNNDDSNLAALRLIDWKRGTPYIYRAEDFDTIMHSNAIFARKFDADVDNEVIEKIYNTVSLNN